MMTTILERVAYRRETAIQSLLRSRLAILDDLFRMPVAKMGSKYHANRLEVLGQMESQLARIGMTN
jgi:hypothetical protein